METEASGIAPNAQIKPCEIPTRYAEARAIKALFKRILMQFELCETSRAHTRKPEARPAPEAATGWMEIADSARAEAAETGPSGGRMRHTCPKS
jgi:hypothetical protein